VLSVPIGANVGGIATPVGTPPNAVALAGLAKQGIALAFGSWVVLALPVVVLTLLFVWRLLLKLYPPSVQRLELTLTGTFDRSGKAIALYVIAGATVLLWITEALHGISSSIVSFGAVAALAMAGVVGEKEIRRVPWEVLWLVAGGIALDVALRTTGLAAWFVESIHWDALGSLGVVLIFGAVAILISEFLSNTVCATLMMPLAVGVGASQSGGDPQQTILTALVVGIGVSFAMALPISTPPNAIAISTGLIQTKHMARVGIIIGIVGLVFLLVLGELYWPLVLSVL
jgi:sodium-dependent dicarboxylate transporter 2/3/5